MDNIYIYVCVCVCVCCRDKDPKSYIGPWASAEDVDWSEDE